MSTNLTLQRLISKTDDIFKLQTLLNTGLDIMVNDIDLNDFTEVDKIELVDIINSRIIELEV